MLRSTIYAQYINDGFFIFSDLPYMSQNASQFLENYPTGSRGQDTTPYGPKPLL